MSEPGLGKPANGAGLTNPHAERARPVVECKTTGRSRHLADDGRHFTDRAVRFAGIVVGIVNAAPVVIFSVAQHPVDEDVGCGSPPGRGAHRARGRLAYGSMVSKP